MVKALYLASEECRPEEPDFSEELGDVPQTFDPATVDPNLDMSFDEEDNDKRIDEEIREFEKEEASFPTVFISLERLACFAHVLQCAVRYIDRSEFQDGARSRAQELVYSFRKSPKAMAALLKVRIYDRWVCLSANASLFYRRPEKLS